MTERGCGWGGVVTVAVAAAVLAGCGTQAEHAEQDAQTQGPAADGVRAADPTPGPGRDGTRGQADGRGASAGAGGKGGAGGTLRSPDLVKVGLLDCPRDGLVSGSGATMDEGAFDGADAATTPEAALEVELKQLRKGDAFNKRLAALPYERSTAPGESSREINFIGLREDGTVAGAIGVEQGGKSKSWISTGSNFCSPGPARFGAPGTYDNDDGDGPVLGEPPDASRRS